MRDFKQQLERYGKELRDTRCPYSEAELDRKIRRAIWDDRRDATQHISAPIKRHIPIKWLPAAAAACLLAVLLPLGLQANNADDIHTVNVDGEQVYFACNNGCSADATIETFKTMLR